MKLIGLLLVLVAPTLAGFFKAQSYMDSRDILHSFIMMLSFIKQEVGSYLTPQQEIYKKFYDRHLDKCSFLDVLKEEKTDTPLSTALEKSKDKLMLKKEAYDLLYEFGNSFGTLSQGDECRRCEKLISQLEEIYKTQKEETSEKIRLCRTVGCMLGIGLALLLW